MALTQVQGAMVGPTGFANLSGITFPATQVPSADANTLDDYEEGTWTVTDLSGAGLTLTNNTGLYTKIGSMVYWAFDVVFPSTANATALTLSMPFTLATFSRSGSVGGGFVTYTGSNQVITGAYANSGTNWFTFYTSAGNNVTNANMSGKEFSVAGFFRASA